MDIRKQAEKAEQFRKLHHGPRLLLLPNAWDVVSARILEECGHPAIATSSAAVAFSLGYPDGQRISREEMLEVAGDRKSTRLNSSHGYISYAVFCLKKNTETSGEVTQDWKHPKRLGYDAYKKKLIAKVRYQKPSLRHHRGSGHRGQHDDPLTPAVPS